MRYFILTLLILLTTSSYAGEVDDLLKILNDPNIHYNDKYQPYQEMTYIINRKSKDKEFIKHMIFDCDYYGIQEYAYSLLTPYEKKEILKDKRTGFKLKDNFIQYTTHYGDRYVADVYLNSEIQDPYKANGFRKAIEQIKSEDIIMELIENGLPVLYQHELLKKIKNQDWLADYYKKADNAIKTTVLDNIYSNDQLKKIIDEDIDAFGTATALKKLHDSKISYDYYKKNPNGPYTSLIIGYKHFTKDNLTKIMTEDTNPKNLVAAAYNYYNITDDNLDDVLNKIKDKKILLALKNHYDKGSYNQKRVKNRLRKLSPKGPVLFWIGTLLFILINNFWSNNPKGKKTETCTNCQNTYDFAESWCPVCGNLNKISYNLNVYRKRLLIIPSILILTGIGFITYQTDSLWLLVAWLSWILAGLLTITFPIIYKDDEENNKKMERLNKNRKNNLHSNPEIRKEFYSNIDSEYTLKEYINDEPSEDLKEFIKNRIQKIKAKEKQEQQNRKEEQQKRERTKSTGLTDEHINEIARKFYGKSMDEHLAEKNSLNEIECTLEEAKKGASKTDTAKYIKMLNGITDKLYINTMILGEDDEFEFIKQLCEKETINQVLLDLRISGFHDYELSGDKTIITIDGIFGTVALWIANKSDINRFMYNSNDGEQKSWRKTQ